MFGFSPQLVVTHEERTSNAQLIGYDRAHGELRFVRQFRPGGGPRAPPRRALAAAERDGL